MAREAHKKQRMSMPEQPAGERVGNFNEVALGYGVEQGREEAARCLQCKKQPCVAGCPVEIDIPRFIKEMRTRRPGLGRPHPEEPQQPARRLRPRLPPGGPVREGLRPEQEGQPGGHRPPGAAGGRLRGSQGGGGAAGDQAAHRQEGGGDRLRPGRADLRRRPGPGGPRGHHLRGPARAGRRAHLRHPRVPPAQAHRPARGRLHLPPGRQVRLRPGHRAHHHHPAAEGRRLRGRLHRHRGRPALLHEHPRREPQRRLLGQRVPHPLQPDEGLPLPGIRHAHQARAQRGGGGRGQRGPGQRPHRPAPGRGRGLPGLPPLGGGDAGPGGGDTPRGGGGRPVPLPHPAHRDPRGRRAASPA